MKKDEEILTQEGIKQTLKLVLNYHHLLEINLKVYNNQFSFNRANYLAFEETVTKQINELKEHKKGLSL